MSTPSEPSDPPIQLAQLPTGPMAYTDEGSGPPIVLVHGYPGGPRDWRWLAPCLSGFRVLRPQLPGLGDTPLSTGSAADLAGRASLVLAFVDALELERFILVGHSMGGGIVMDLAVRAPQRVSHLVLLSSIGLRPHVGLRRFRPEVAWAALDSWMRPALMPVMRKAFQLGGFPPRWTDEELLHTTHCAASLDFELQQRNATALRCPTLLAYARDDALIEPAITDELDRACPGGPRMFFEDGGHNIQKAHAVELGVAILQFAQETS
jgi:pimeloyl-ACP methyl ester carboxylesterase